MAGARLGFGRLVRADLRQNKGGFVGVAVAVFVASALVTGLGVLVESGVRGGLAPVRYTAAPVVVGASQQVEVPEDLPVPLHERAPLPQDAAAHVAAVSGVDHVVADVTVPLADAGGHRVEAHPWSAVALAGSALREGAEPAGADEVVVTAGGAEGLGARILLAHGGVPAEYRVVGVVDAVGTERAPQVYLSSTRIAELDPRGGAAQTLGVFPAQGADAAELAAAIRDAVPGLTVQTGAGRGDIEFLDSGAARSTLVTIGSAFVGTCVLVALFIVSGTLSLSVQSRRRDFALLRAVGASPKQVHALVSREVMSIAVVAGVLGIVPGYLLSGVLQRAFVSGGVIPGDFALAVGPSPAAGALLLVLGAAWAAARIAARRPAGLDPIEALRESSSGPTRIGRARFVSGGILAVAGLAVSAVPLFARGVAAAGASAAAALMLIVALALLGPWLVALVMRAAAPLLSRLSAADFLASANGIASSRRLAGAILPIALGVGLGLVQIGAPSIVAHESAAQADAGVTAALRVSAPAGLSSGAVAGLGEIPGVTAVGPIALSGAIIGYKEFDGTPKNAEPVLQGVDPAAVERTMDLEVRSGALTGLGGAETVAVSSDAAQTWGVGLGDAIEGWFGDGTPLRATVVAVYERGLGFGDLTMDAEAVRARTTSGLDAFALVAVDAGQADQVQAAATARGLHVVPGSGQKAAGADAQSQQGWVNLVALIVILGYIAIAVVNTLVMATGERSREFALLQLIGSSRRQVRAMMRTEAVMVAVISTAFGVAVAIPPLIGMSIGISGRLIPELPVLAVLGLVGAMGALALATLWVATLGAMRTRPIEEIGSRQ
ncbi:ABC transporter permease [Microbacterium azadirachtae]|uniref:FtsX-like permease family protein n=1 Tax=Microbacterium azadirachtae TaxID=582680 RepID=A0A0F0LI41_9MICO|nr:ABC transporter permease [Microbacterium azadirachtae]KJL32882.1 FtsX-like permease family protein [Microbacterium azadirachtae]